MVSIMYNYILATCTYFRSAVFSFSHMALFHTCECTLIPCFSVILMTSYTIANYDNSHTHTVLEIMVSIQTLSDHFGILSDPKKFGSDIWLSTMYLMFIYIHTVMLPTEVICTENVYLCFHYVLMHIYCGTNVLLLKYVRANLKLSDPK